MKENFVWQTASPESQGMSTPKLDVVRDTLATRGTKTFLVVRHDRIVYEWYAPDYSPTRRHYTASLAKALVGGVSLMVALNDGRLAIDDPAWKYIPAWKGHAEKSKITIRHLATHSSGIEDAEEGGLPHDQLPGWKGAFWKREPNPFSIARDEAPVIFPPGSDYAYSNPGMAMLAYAVTASLAVGCAPQSDIQTLLRERIMKPIGVPDEEWSIGYGVGYEVDGLTLYANWGGGSYTARAVARLGRLMLRMGDGEGEPLVAPEWVQKVVMYAGTPLPDRPAGNPQPGSGLGWWTNFDGVWGEVPRDAFAGAGADNQILLVIPSLDLIIVRNGALLGDASKGEGFWGGLEKYLFNPLMRAVGEAANQRIAHSPYPPSPVITGVTWAPPEGIVHKANGKNGDGSDNWPVTYADDGNLYTAYGDGYGFDPIVPTKLGLGFARVIGGPTDFTGENIRSDAENTGMGRAGKKASGILMVDGLLYIWARNADNNGHHCQLAWSRDYARTWMWSDWKFTQFGYLTFINFGLNYTGVPDVHEGYVYMLSHDHPSAYEPADRFILARVPREGITNRDAYEFFQTLDSDNNPIWTKDIDGRGAVFTNSGGCLRSGMSYNAGLKRYLWWQQNPRHGEDTRFKGGFSIYDAPEPWGPWTTVYDTPEWDVGPGETAAFPTPWMSADGKTCHLVFSGNDNFSVRQVVFTL
ncbi:serine hydrolase [Candidatus Poribacteria bacterium]|nr:serine hydrolase [Candidatus Poribacteria bacterium]